MALPRRRSGKLIPALMLLAVLVPISQAFSSTPTPFTLSPFKAHYSASFDIGFRISGEAVRELRQQQDGSWIFSAQAQAMMATIEESSLFHLKHQQIEPLQYEYLRKLPGKKRHALLSFDWNKQQVLNNVENKPWHLKIKPGTLDKLNYQLQLRLDLLAGQQKLSYQVADGGRVKTYQFEVVGEEQLQTLLGPLETIKVARRYENASNKQTMIWFAKSLDFLMVKLSKIDKKGKRSDLVIERIAEP